ncbi:MAG: carboxypeptidase-like regulatory domain-containing protein, partial [Fidelibacterota bacterium]
MKKRILIFSVSIILSFMSGCERKITKIITPENPNDALHGDIVGKVVQKDSNAKVYVSQIAPIDSAEIDPEDGSFEFTYLRIGNYDLTIRADNYRIYTLSNVMVQGGGVTYLGEIDLSTVPDLVAAHYPPDKSEVVYSNRFSRLSI